MAEVESWQIVLDGLKRQKPGNSASGKDDEKLDIDDNNQDQMRTIEEDLSDAGDEVDQVDLLVKGMSFRLGQPRIRTSFIEKVDVVPFENSDVESKLQDSSVLVLESPGSRPLHSLDEKEVSESMEILFTPKNVRMSSLSSKIEVICTPRRKSIRITPNITRDMRRISLRLNERLVLKTGNPKDDYEIHEELGSGSFGKVRRAVCKITKKEVAIKRIKKKKLDDMNRALLENEIRILREIKHDSVVELLDVCDSQRYICLIMELCSGGDVFDWLDAEEHLDEVRAAGVIHQIVTAVDYLHGRGVVHRDLKLENLLVVKQDAASKKLPVVVKIADFGFATTIKTPNALIEGTCGSLNYVAPEVLTGRPYTKACDYWSIGVILYAMLGGYLPFYEDSESGGRTKTFRRIQQGVYDFDDPVWAKVGELAKSVVTGLLTVKVKARLSCKLVAKHRWVRNCAASARRSFG